VDRRFRLLRTYGSIRRRNGRRFTNEWAHYLFVGKQVVRFTAAGDRGVDIAVFDAGQDFHGIWDAYQCKHYNDPLRPSDIYVELGKVLWFSFSGEYTAPRSYTFIAPCGIGTKLNNFLKTPSKLKQELISNWEKYCRTEITSTQEIPLEGAFLAHVQAFDFGIFQGKQPLTLIDEHKKSPYHLSRFGGSFPARPAGQMPPDAIAPAETKYVEELYLAYGDHLQKAVASTTVRRTPCSADRTRSPARVSQKRECFKQRPETFGDFARRLSKIGV
jgi:hypothetical protein